MYQNPLSNHALYRNTENSQKSSPDVHRPTEAVIGDPKLLCWSRSKDRNTVKHRGKLPTERNDSAIDERSPRLLQTAGSIVQKPISCKVFGKFLNTQAEARNTESQPAVAIVCWSASEETPGPTLYEEHSQTSVLKFCNSPKMTSQHRKRNQKRKNRRVFKHEEHCSHEGEIRDEGELESNHTALLSWPCTACCGIPGFLPVLGLVPVGGWTTDCCEFFKVWSPCGTSNARKRETTKGTKLGEGGRVPGTTEESTETQKPVSPFCVCTFVWGYHTESPANSLAGPKPAVCPGFHVPRFQCRGACRGSRCLGVPRSRSHWPPVLGLVPVQTLTREPLQCARPP